MAFGKLKGRWKMAAGIAAGIIIAGLAAWYFFGNKSEAQAQVVTTPVTRGTIDVKVSGTGNVEPADTSNVIAKTGGNIIGVSAVSGQHVQKGQLLFTLDSGNIQAQIEKARLDQKLTQLDIGTTRDQLKEQQVYAPVSGRVTSIQVTEGQDVQKGAVMLTILDINNLTFQIPFSDVSNVKVGQKADVTITDLGASGLTGKVTKVNRSAVADSNGTLVYIVTIMIGNPGALVPGMQAQVAVHTDKGLIYGYNTGPLEWASTTLVRSGVSGNLTKLNVDENVVVKKGQLLATIDSDSLKSQVNSQSLKLQQSQLNISELEKQLPDYYIYAPADGIFTMTASTSNTVSGNNNTSNSASNVSDKWQVGDAVKAGQIVGVIDATAGMVVTVPVDEVDIAKVKLGQKADITFDALPDQKFTGSVTTISDEGVVSNNAATFDIQVALDKTDGVKTGMTANVEVLVNHKEGTLLVPIEAVQDREGRKFVILDSNGSGGTNSGSGSGPDSASRAGTESRSGLPGTGNRSRTGTAAGGVVMTGRMTPVETGLYNETLIEITKGVQEGDKVVLPSVARTSGSSGAGGIRVPMGGGVRPPGTTVIRQGGSGAR